MWRESAVDPCDVAVTAFDEFSDRFIEEEFVGDVGRAFEGDVWFAWSDHQHGFLAVSA